MEGMLVLQEQEGANKIKEAVCILMFRPEGISMSRRGMAVAAAAVAADLLEVR